MKLFIIMAITYFFISCTNRNDITNEVEKIIENKDLKLGIGIYDFENDEIYLYNGHDKFPMQSVYKLPIVIEILDLVDKNQLRLDDKINISKEDRHPNIYSPIRDKYPNGVEMSLSEIILYTIANSDNVGCDVLIKLGGGIDSIGNFMTKNNLSDISIKNYEREIQSNWEIQFENWATPAAIINLLKQFNNNRLLNPNTTDYLWSVMTQSNTGSINRLLSSDIIVGYKTGSSGVGENGIIAALNCAGIMKQEEKEIAFAIFITDSKEDRETNMNIIAQIGKIIDNFYLKTKK